MINKINKKYNLIIVFFSAFLLVFFGTNNSVRAENSSKNVQNTVSATAKSGGNTIENSGNITAGNESASVKAVNIINGEGENGVKEEARAEGAQATVEMNGEKKSCVAENGEKCQVEINNTREEQTLSENADPSFLEKVWDFLISWI